MLLCYRVKQRPWSNDVEEFVLPNDEDEFVSTTERTTSIVEVVIDISDEAITTPSIKGKNNDCSICIEEIKHWEMFLIFPICCHRFHYACIRPWLEENKTCPMCRTHVRDAPLQYAGDDDDLKEDDNHQDLQSSEIV
ncbi:E3 ubiquitin-protein ligase ATL4-like [Solanum stenotomum]|uniref:E3 ubiquitin-protein ligase ATL4-like n=1 Tax=Solanum stenotomum TaxID=172797 RepID=UPI0020D1620E|nr:E3 ubiquitin-protein ligase ATL4-like [Solanum stenotomum]